MRILHRLFICIVLFCSFSLSVNANEGGAEAPAEGGGHGGGESRAAAGPKVDPPEWIELQAEIQTLKAKIATKEKVIEELFVEKNKTTDEEKSREIFNSLKKEHKELTQFVEEYEQKRSVLKYRFPEKGITVKQQYKRIEAKSLDDLENKTSLEGKLQGAQTTLRRQFKKATAPVDQEKKSKEIKSNIPEITDPAAVTK